MVTNQSTTSLLEDLIEQGDIVPAAEAAIAGGAQTNDGQPGAGDNNQQQPDAGQQQQTDINKILEEKTGGKLKSVDDLIKDRKLAVHSEEGKRKREAHLYCEQELEYLRKMFTNKKTGLRAQITKGDYYTDFYNTVHLIFLIEENGCAHIKDDERVIEYIAECFGEKDTSRFGVKIDATHVEVYIREKETCNIL